MLSKAFVGYWAGFVATLAEYVGLYHVLFDFILSDGEQAATPPILGLVLSITAVIVGKHFAVRFEELDLAAAPKEPA